VWGGGVETGGGRDWVGKCAVGRKGGYVRKCSQKTKEEKQGRHGGPLGQGKELQVGDMVLYVCREVGTAVAEKGKNRREVEKTARKGRIRLTARKRREMIHFRSTAKKKNRQTLNKGNERIKEYPTSG